MSIDFSRGRWERLKADYTRWWAGELDRPILQVTLTGADPGRAEPATRAHAFTSFYDSSVTAEAIVDRWDYDLSTQRFAGDAFPSVLPNFGPGVLAVVLGARPENREDTVWFHAPGSTALADLQLSYHPDDAWLVRILDICRAARDRWEGMVQICMTDIGGAMDVLASFRPGQGLLLDLYDHPEDVLRLSRDIHDFWFHCYDEINGILEPVNPGYCAWARVFSCEPTYMLQCDFSYMISPEMFARFVRPELALTCGRLTNSFYHLDGPGALAHLDSLLSIEDLKGIQYVPGAGQPGPLHWIDVYRRVLDAGKRLQLINVDTMGIPFEVLDALAQKLGSLKGIIAAVSAPVSGEDEIRKRLEDYGHG